MGAAAKSKSYRVEFIVIKGKRLRLGQPTGVSIFYIDAK